ncbi:hypothetical protein K505DRAFT_361323 [Melanomma pulvis-pyrius CBS 109.77]|uniref:Uncharacterized protein n=1 Tax=Melanomma pulvis-pyrius CBS 109.77 TaxID=1314802 RepID=A0A6A6XCY4_9PLEO|nr:hypothetical protein K505DRAFT_361323 [Melanomma pulvis-pyrius CBS 109.77]
MSSTGKNSPLVGLAEISPLSIAVGPNPTSTVEPASCASLTNNGHPNSEPPPLIPWHPKDELDEDDFHSGAPQFVLAGDNTKFCPSILLTRQLLEDIRAAIATRSRLFQLHETIGPERQDIVVTRERLYFKILELEFDMDTLRKGLRDETKDRRIQDLEEAKRMLEQERQDLKLRDKQLLEKLLHTEQEWSELQFKVDLVWDRALKRIGLIEAETEEQAELPESPTDPEPQPDLVDIPENTWNEAIDYSELVSGPNEWKCTVHDHPDSTFNNDYYDYFTRPDPKQAAQELAERKKEFEHAEYEFDIHRECYDAEFLEWRVAQQGRLDANDLEVEFGPIWLRRGQEVTRMFRDAEEAYYIAQANAEEAGVGATQDKDGPVDYEGDGHVGQGDEWFMSNRKRKRVEDWMDAHTVREAWKSEADLQSNPSQHYSVLEDWPKRRQIADYSRRVGRDR